MARLVEASFWACCTEWAWGFCASLGTGSTHSPTHTQKDCVESDLSALKLRISLCCCGEAPHWAPGLDVQFMKLPGWSCAASSLRLILRSTRCEGGVGSLFGLAGQGVTKIASGLLE
eukprot:935425-Pelagomonas_calceolata.AAC.1